MGKAKGPNLLQRLKEQKWIDPVKVDYDTVVTKPVNPSKNNCDFAGWMLQKADGSEEAWDFDTNKVTENITLKEKWTVQAGFVQVTFNSDGGTDVTSQIVEENGVATKRRKRPLKN